MAVVEWTSKISSHVKPMLGKDPIAQLLKFAGAPGIIALSAGSPAEASTPMKKLRLISKIILEEPPKGYGKDLTIYGKAQGFGPLLEHLPEFLDRDNRQVKTKPENIIVTAGSQEALSLLGQMFISQGDKIAVEKPSYIGALEAFRPYNPNYIEIEADQEGIRADSLEKAFQENPDIKFLYTIPTFQNPTGKTMSLKRRQAIAEVLKKYGQIAIEDDPYSELRYEGEHIQSIQSLAPDNVIHLFTFSKTIAPGLRVGGMVFPDGSNSIIKNITDLMKRLKGGAQLTNSYVTQAIVSKYLESGEINNHIQEIIKLYKPRRDVMAKTIEENFPKIFDFYVPEGGMFIWLKLKGELQYLANFIINLDEIEIELEKRHVALAQGKYFFVNPETHELSMRLNFTNQSEENIATGTRVIGEILKEKLRLI
ncbi:MAG: PLP-dependent aminotransferase family protein [Patescibacteria group bacterium]|jgi:2-aminoadipate transaminase